MELTGLIRYINMLGNGSIIASGDKENSIKMRKCSFKACFRKG